MIEFNELESLGRGLFTYTFAMLSFVNRSKHNRCE